MKLGACNKVQNEASVPNTSLNVLCKTEGSVCIHKIKIFSGITRVLIIIIFYLRSGHDRSIRSWPNQQNQQKKKRMYVSCRNRNSELHHMWTCIGMSCFKGKISRVAKKTPRLQASKPAHGHPILGHHSRPFPRGAHTSYGHFWGNQLVAAMYRQHDRKHAGAVVRV